MKQTTLFETFDEQQVTKAARRTDPETSHLAAAAHESSGQSESDREAILHVIRTDKVFGSHGYPLHGITAGEIAEHLGEGWTNVRVSRRTVELERLRLIDRGAARECSVKKTMMLTWHNVE